METIFWKRFTELCDEKGVKPHAVMVKLNLNTGNPTAWKNGRMPGAKALEKIASEVGCQIDYLLGKQEERIKKISPAHDGAELTDEEFNLLDAFRLWKNYRKCPLRWENTEGARKGRHT